MDITLKELLSFLKKLEKKEGESLLSFRLFTDGSGCIANSKEKEFFDFLKLGEFKEKYKEWNKE